jgi:hypothetical protein
MSMMPGENSAHDHSGVNEVSQSAEAVPQHLDDQQSSDGRRCFLDYT